MISGWIALGSVAGVFAVVLLVQCLANRSALRHRGDSPYWDGWLESMGRAHSRQAPEPYDQESER